MRLFIYKFIAYIYVCLFASLLDSFPLFPLILPLLFSFALSLYLRTHTHTLSWSLSLSLSLTHTKIPLYAGDIQAASSWRAMAHTPSLSFSVSLSLSLSLSQSNIWWWVGDVKEASSWRGMTIQDDPVSSPLLRLLCCDYAPLGTPLSLSRFACILAGHSPQGDSCTLCHSQRYIYTYVYVHKHSRYTYMYKYMYIYIYIYIHIYAWICASLSKYVNL